MFDIKREQLRSPEADPGEGATVSLETAFGLFVNTTEQDENH